jgi:hypothetical protein
MGEAVYNPFDLLLLFSERQFRPWWFETGTPSFLIRLLTERETWLPALGQLESDAELLSTLGQPIHLIGVEFSRASRNVVGFEVETV